MFAKPSDFDNAMEILQNNSIFEKDIKLPGVTAVGSAVLRYIYNLYGIEKCKLLRDMDHFPLLNDDYYYNVARQAIDHKLSRNVTSAIFMISSAKLFKSITELENNPSLMASIRPEPFPPHLRYPVLINSMPYVLYNKVGTDLTPTLYNALIYDQRTYAEILKNPIIESVPEEILKAEQDAAIFRELPKYFRSKARSEAKRLGNENLVIPLAIAYSKGQTVDLSNYEPCQEDSSIVLPRSVVSQSSQALPSAAPAPSSAPDKITDSAQSSKNQPSNFAEQNSANIAIQSSNDAVSSSSCEQDNQSTIAKTSEALPSHAEPIKSSQPSSTEPSEAVSSNAIMACSDTISSNSAIAGKPRVSLINAQTNSEQDHSCTPIESNSKDIGSNDNLPKASSSDALSSPNIESDSGLDNKLSQGNDLNEDKKANSQENFSMSPVNVNSAQSEDNSSSQETTDNDLSYQGDDLDLAIEAEFEAQSDYDLDIDLDCPCDLDSPLDDMAQAQVIFSSSVEPVANTKATINSSIQEALEQELANEIGCVASTSYDTQINNSDTTSNEAQSSDSALNSSSTSDSSLSHASTSDNSLSTENEEPDKESDLEKEEFDPIAIANLKAARLLAQSNLNGNSMDNKKGFDFNKLHVYGISAKDLDQLLELDDSKAKQSILPESIKGLPKRFVILGGAKNNALRAKNLSDYHVLAIFSKNDPEYCQVCDQRDAATKAQLCKEDIA